MVFFFFQQQLENIACSFEKYLKLTYIPSLLRSAIHGEMIRKPNSQGHSWPLIGWLGVDYSGLHSVPVLVFIICPALDHEGCCFPSPSAFMMPPFPFSFFPHFYQLPPFSIPACW